MIKEISLRLDPTGDVSLTEGTREMLDTLPVAIRAVSLQKALGLISDIHERALDRLCDEFGLMRKDAHGAYDELPGKDDVIADPDEGIGGKVDEGADDDEGMVGGEAALLLDSGSALAFCGLSADPTTVHYYGAHHGFPRWEVKQGRRVYWNQQTLVDWMQAFVAAGRVPGFPTARYQSIKSALNKALRENGTLWPSFELTDTQADLIIRVGDAGTLKADLTNYHTRTALIRRGMLIPVSDSAGVTEMLQLTESGAYVYARLSADD